MTSNEIKKLSDYAHSRLRTEMYLGSRSQHTQQVLLFENDKPILEEVTWVPAAFTAFREILDNALDEVVGHSQGNRIDIEYDEITGITSVSDNGRGIPFDIDPVEKVHKATMVMTSARAGRNFGDRGEVAGTNGIGASAVNFCSEWYKMDIVRDNKKFTQEFHEGNAVIDDLQIKAPNIRELKSDKTGTKISFKLSETVFPTRLLPLKFIRSRVYEIAAINASVHIYFNGERIKVKPTIEKTLFEKDKLISLEVNEDGFRSKFLVKPNFHEGGDFYHSIVNNIPALNGGHHIDAFRRGFIAGILNALEREAKRRKLTPNRSDVNEGLLVLNITTMKAPNFDSQSKTRLINEEAGKYVTKLLSDENIFKDIVRKNKEWVEEIFERTAERTNRKDAEDLVKAGKKLSRKKVPKLTDATSVRRTDCILFLAEGDCLGADTPVMVLEGESFGTKAIKDIRPDDLVLTHENRIRKVTNIAHKVSDGIKLALKNGETLTVSPTHKMLAYSKAKQQVDWVPAGLLNLSEYQLVRSKLVDINGFWEIQEIVKTDDPTYALELRVVDDQGKPMALQSSLTHKFAVFDMNRILFEMITADQLNPDVHCLVAISYPAVEVQHEV